jgi:integrase
MDTPSSSTVGADHSEYRGTAVIHLSRLVTAYLEDYQLRQFRVVDARGRVKHLRAVFGAARPVIGITTSDIRRYQVLRRQQGAAAATVNRETAALGRMLRIALQLGWLPSIPVFPARLRENPPRQGFFEHHEYLAVRRRVPPAFRDVLDFAYHSGWRRREILEFTWREVDLDGGVIRLAPERSKTRVGRVLPISPPLAAVLIRRRRRHVSGRPTVFGRDGVTVRAWRRLLADACAAAGIPSRLLHDCRRTAARNLVRAGVPERVAMMFTGHRSRAVFDRYNIVNE